MCDYVCHAPRRPRRSNRTILSETARPNQIEADARLRGPRIGAARCEDVRPLGSWGTIIVTQPPPPPGWVPPGAPPPGAPTGYGAPPPGSPPGYVPPAAVYGPPMHKPGVVALRPLGPRRLLRRRVQDDPPQPHARWSGWPPLVTTVFMVVPVLVTLALAAGRPPRASTCGRTRRPAASPRSTARRASLVERTWARSSGCSRRWCSTACWCGSSPRRSSAGVPRSGEAWARHPRPAAAGWSG